MSRSLSWMSSSVVRHAAAQHNIIHKALHSGAENRLLATLSEKKVPSEPHIAAQFEFGDHAAFTLPQFIVILQRASRSSTKSTDRLRPVYLIFSLLTYFLAALKETLGPQNKSVLSLAPQQRYPQPQLRGLQLSTDSRVERGAHSCRWISAARAHAAARRQMSTGQTDGRKDTRPLHRPCTAYCAGRVASVNVRGVKPHCMQKTHAWPVPVTVRIWTDCVASLLTQLGEVIAVVPRHRAVTTQYHDAAPSPDSHSSVQARPADDSRVNDDPCHKNHFRDIHIFKYYTLRTRTKTVTSLRSLRSHED